MRIFGIDPGSQRTGYGCVESRAGRHVLVACGAITASPRDGFPQRLARIHHELTTLLSTCRPDCVAVETLFHAANARSALKLGHARGVAILAAVEAGCSIVEYTPAEVKRAIVGYGRAEKHQVQQMIKLLLGLTRVPSPHDAADALAVAICHSHSMPPGGIDAGSRNGDQKSRIGDRDPESRTRTADQGRGGRGTQKRALTSWRHYRPAH